MSLLTKTVVTGANGFIGQELVRRLLDMDVETIPIVYGDFEDSFPVPHVHADIRVKDALAEFLDAGTVLFHMAAMADVGASVRDPRADFEINMGGLFEVLESVRQQGARLVFPSTASIFDAEDSLPVGEKSYARPISPYAAAKLAGEGYCSAYFRSYGIDTRVARMFSVYGVGMSRFLIYDLVQKIRANNSEISIHGTGEQIRDYLYIDDAVRGLIHIAQEGEPGEDYNLASGEPTKILDLAHRIADLLGCTDIKISPTNSDEAGHVPKWYVDIEKIRGIGFSPEIPLEDGLKRTVAWLLEKPVH